MKNIIRVILIPLVITVGAIIFIIVSSAPVSNDSKQVSFAVNQGDGLSAIASRLEQNELIRNRYTFMLTAYYLKLNSKLQAGLFRISPSMSTTEVISKLSKGGSHDVWFKIIEGSRVEEFSPNKDFESIAKMYEGTLFPDSYLIPKDFTSEQIFELIQANFRQKFELAKADSIIDLSDNQALILASLLEREGRSKESKRFISGIIQNRLRIGMPLQVDATVQYAKDTIQSKIVKNNQKYDYWNPISKADLQINSSFNTYKNTGLPPSPICNPGYDSLFAAFHPVETDYLFYITGNDNQMHYAKTLDQHNENISKYLR